MTNNRTMPTFYKFSSKNFNSKLNSKNMLNSRNKFSSRDFNMLCNLNFNNKLSSKNLNNKKQEKKLTKVRVEKYLPNYKKNPSNGNLAKSLTKQQTSDHHK